MLLVNKAGIELIKHFESLHDGDLKVIGLQPKMCPAGIWTVGYGHALSNGHGGLLRGSADKIEAYQQYPALDETGAVKLLTQDLKDFSRQVEKLISVPVTDNQFSAMVSLAYNIGVNAFKTSSVLRLFSCGDIHGASDAFLLWIKGTSPKTGKRIVLNGLVSRREAEKHLFLS